MRDSLTVLALLLIGVLTAALVAPYLVDWDAHRDFVARELSRAAGTAVSVRGHVDLRLLPTPRIHAAEVSIGGRATGQPCLAVDQLDAELSVAALLRGQVQVVDATLVRPSLDVAEGRGDFGLSVPAEAASERVAIDHVAVRGASIVARLADGRRVALSDLDFDAAAAGLRGPFKVQGHAEGVAFRLATGTLDGSRLRAKLHMDGDGVRPSLDLDGLVSPRPEAGGLAFDGAGTVAGTVPLEGATAVVPWRMGGRLAIDRSGVAASDLDLRAGADDRAMIASGDGSIVATGERTKVTLRLRGSGLDLDRMAVASDGSDRAPPTGLALIGLVLDGGAGRPAAMPFDVDASAHFDTVTLGARTMPGAAISIAFGAAPDAGLLLDLDGPEGARLSLDGRLGLGAGRGDADFRGAVDVRARDLRRSAAWLRPVAPEVAGWLGTLPDRGLSAKGKVELSPTRADLRDAAIEIGGTTYSGTLSLASGAGGKPARLSADLSTPALFFAALPDPAALASATRDLDLDLSLSADAVSIGGLEPERPPLAAEHASAHLSKADGEMVLDRLSLSASGASLTAKASRGASAAAIEARIDAPRLGPLADALAGLLPRPWASMLRSRASVLSPLDATFRLEARQTGAGDLEPTRLSVAGAASGTTFSVALDPDRGSALSGASSVEVEVGAADGGALLRQFGVAVPERAIGPAHVEARGRGTAADGFAGRAEAILGRSVLAFTGRAGVGQADGRASLTATDAAPFLAAFGLGSIGSAFPLDASADVGWAGADVALRDLAVRAGGSVARGELSIATRLDQGAASLHGRLSLDRLSMGTLLAPTLGISPSAVPDPTTWSRQAFGSVPAAWPSAEVALTVGDMPLGLPFDAPHARDVTLLVRTGPGSVELTEASGSVAGGKVEGALRLRRDGAAASAAARLAWAGLPLDLGSLSARSSGKLDLAGAGPSPASLVASLAGTGQTSLVEASLARTDPAAPARVLARVTARDAAAERGSALEVASPADPSALRAELSAALDPGPLRLGSSADVPLSMVGGTLRMGPLQARGTAGSSSDPVPWTADAAVSVGLVPPSVAVRTSLHGLPGAGGDAVAILDAGPLGGPPRRELDVGALVEAVQARAIARAQERIDLVEQDIRERAAFERQRKAWAALDRAARERAAADAARRRDEEQRLKAEIAAAARADAASRVTGADPRTDAVEPKRPPGDTAGPPPAEGR